MTARQWTMGMHYIDFSATMEFSNVSQNARKQECPRTRQAASPWQREIAEEFSRGRRRISASTFSIKRLDSQYRVGNAQRG